MACGDMPIEAMGGALGSVGATWGSSPGVETTSETSAATDTKNSASPTPECQYFSRMKFQTVYAPLADALTASAAVAEGMH